MESNCSVMHKPQPSEYHPSLDGYIKIVSQNDPIAALEEQIIELQAFAGEVPVELEEYAYAPGKWTIKEIMGHLCDAERIFAYRALRIGRGDTTPLPGFDEDKFVPNGAFNKRSLYDLVHELCMVRQTTLVMLRRMPKGSFDNMGSGDGKPLTVRALIFVMVGHVKHHLKFMRTHYL